MSATPEEVPENPHATPENLRSWEARSVTVRRQRERRAAMKATDSATSGGNVDDDMTSQRELNDFPDITAQADCSASGGSTKAQAGSIVSGGSQSTAQIMDMDVNHPDDPPSYNYNHPDTWQVSKIPFDHVRRATLMDVPGGDKEQKSYYKSFKGNRIFSSRIRSPKDGDTIGIIERYQCHKGKHIWYIRWDDDKTSWVDADEWRQQGCTAHTGLYFEAPNEEPQLVDDLNSLSDIYENICNMQEDEVYENFPPISVFSEEEYIHAAQTLIDRTPKSDKAVANSPESTRREPILLEVIPGQQGAPHRQPSGFAHSGGLGQS